MPTTSLASKLLLSGMTLLLGGLALPAQAATRLDPTMIQQLTGKKGKLDLKEGVFTVFYPRTDLRVTVAGVHVTPPMGLTSYAAFTVQHGMTMVMGDTVMTQDQVNPVMGVALSNGLEVTALHNHFLWDSPKIWYMHVGGMGDERKLAIAVGKVFAKIQETSTNKPQTPHADLSPAETTLDPKKIDAIVGVKGQMIQGVYKVVVGRSTRMDGVTIGKAMGLNTWGSFIGSDAHAVVDGDFAMTDTELQPVLRSLRGHGINVVAIHNHMVGETPRIMFLHYWGVGSTTQLAGALKAALEKTHAR